MKKLDLGFKSHFKAHLYKKSPQEHTDDIWAFGLVIVCGSLLAIITILLFWGSISYFF